MYKPQPIDTTGIELDADILELSELISKNTHEVWSAGRIRDGWTYGETRDDEKKTHPCLVPYEELSESEKEYDRNTSMETLKLIVRLGYKIQKS
jgi:hypothetical protein